MSAVENLDYAQTNWEFTGSRAAPDRLVVSVDGLSPYRARMIAQRAQMYARRRAPKLSGRSARRIRAEWGDGHFGLRWADPWVWFQEHGIRPFTMRSLAGKTIPMWVDDPTGDERKRNPKAKTRVTASGKTQVLIFRRAAHIGQRRSAVDIARLIRERGRGRRVGRHASYPGAPGRIGVREARSPFTRTGRVGGRVAPFNVGVRWRHPGLAPRNFLYWSLHEAAADFGILSPVVEVR